MRSSRALEQIFARAAGDRRRGASEIEARLLSDLLAVSDQWSAEDLSLGLRTVVAAHPAMANLRSLAALAEAADGVADLPALFEGRRLRVGEIGRMLAERAFPLVSGSRRVLTLSRSSSVAAVVAGAAARGWGGQVVVFDGSPGGGGLDQAELLSGRGLDARSQPDALMAAWFETAADCVVVVGADAVSPERVVNVCGTRVLAELAAARSVEVVVVADSAKDLGDGELDELLAAAARPAQPGPGRSWSLFEALPASLVGSRVDENGVRPGSGEC